MNNKLSKKVFAEMMETLNAYYVNFKVDLDNQLVVNVWYRAFENFDDKTFKDMILNYCTNNIYAPQSPTHIIEITFNKLLESQMGSTEAFNKIIEWWADDNISNDKLIRNIADINEALLQTFNDMRLSHIGRYAKITDDFTKNQLKKEFIESYEKNLKNFIRGCIQKGNLLLGDTSILKIGSDGK